MTLPITLHAELRIERSLIDRLRAHSRATGRATAVIDRRRFACRRGAWATWIPTLGAKYLNSVDGRLNCLHRTAPARDDVLGNGAGPVGKDYSRDEWRRAYLTPVSRRAAENVVAAQRLHAAGLGPRVLGLCIALRYFDAGRIDGSFAAGFLSENVLDLPAKPPATEAEFHAAGVALDKTRSALRQQLNGYVVDLNAAVGVVPVDAEDEVTALAARIEDSAADAAGRRL